MSYDVYLLCPYCKKHDDDEHWWNYTFNISPMLYDKDVNIDIKKWDNKKAKEIISELEEGIKALKANPEKYIAMNPSNNWGDYNTLLSCFLKPMLKAFKENPNFIIEVSY